MNASHDQVVTDGNNSAFTADWSDPGLAIMDPAVIHGVLYGDTVSKPYEAVALNPETGKLLWSHRFPNMMMNSPITLDGLIFFGVGNNMFSSAPVTSHPDVRGTGLSEVVALNAITGVTAWVYQTPGEDMPTFDVTANHLFVVNGSEQVLEFAPTTGKITASLTIPSYVSMASPVLEGSRLYFGGAFPYDMYAVNLQPLSIAWKTPTRSIGGLDDDPPVASQHMVYTESVYDDQGKVASQLIAFNVRTGAIVWQTRLGFGELPVGGQPFESGVPLLRKGIIYLGSAVSDAVYAVDAGTGKLLWSNALAHQRIDQAPVWVDGVLLVGTEDGMLYALDPNTGHVLREQHFHGGFMPGVPFVDGNTIFFGTQTGGLFARPITLLIGNKR
jgi:outer membrane protein assembly factor BamB